jgi:hypothetical protein
VAKTAAIIVATTSADFNRRIAAASLAISRPAVYWNGKGEKSPVRRIAFVLLGLIAGYLLFAFAGYWAIELFSGNMHDRSVEASMTSVFAIGPAGAIVGLIAGFIAGARRRGIKTPPPSENSV